MVEVGHYAVEIDHIESSGEAENGGIVSAVEYELRSTAFDSEMDVPDSCLKEGCVAGPDLDLRVEELEEGGGEEDEL